jgi:kumamolisin
MSQALCKTSAAIAVLAAIAASNARAASPAVDMGHAGNQSITLTVALPLSNEAAAEALMVRMATPGDAHYGRFMTPDEVQAQFGPNEADVQQVSSTLSAAGLTVTRSSNMTLSVSGNLATLEHVFQTNVHQFAVPASGRSAGFTYHAALSKPVVPSAISAKVQSVVGFSNAPVFRSHLMQAPSQIGSSPVRRLSDSGSGSGGGLSARFGQLTVLDFDQLYDVNPLLKAGIDGKGRTIGIVTLASFTQSDAFTYWNSLGLKTNPKRITVVNVDGGSGPISDNAGSSETTVDVQQSGGIAPAANIIVYEAPNTSQAFLDAFVKAVSDNKADAISTSFGEPEIFDTVTLGGTVTNPLNGEQASFLQALHQQLVIAGLQGQSLSAAAGDSGAFDTVRAFGFDLGFTDPLTVDYPGSDPALTAAGGTTLPGPQTFGLPSGNLTINNPVERVWGWDYLEPLCEALGLPATTEGFFECGIFSAGTGGGVSVLFPLPAQQFGIIGTQLSQAHQSFIENDVTPSVDFFDLAANFPGRNVPDVSFNADPETGYEVPYTSSDPTIGFEVLELGGTSFVGPQLDGVTALLAEKTGHRIGLLSVLLYNLQRAGASFGPAPAIRTISTGDNWFYKGRNGYSPAVGVGTLDVTNLARIVF